MQSSRVGVSTSACVSGSSGSTKSIIGQAEGGGLARAGLRLADHVLAVEQVRDRLLLDRARRLVADVAEGGAEMQAEREGLERRIQANAVEQLRLKGMLATYSRRVEAAPRRESELTELMRDYQIVQESYNSLLAKSQSSNIAADLERRQIGQQFKMIDAARLPERPISPDRDRINADRNARRLCVCPGVSRPSGVPRYDDQDRRRRRSCLSHCQSWR